MQGLKINILRCVFFSWDYRPLVIFLSVPPTLRDLRNVGEKHTHAAP